MRKALATPVHVSWVVLAAVAVMLLAAGYNMATTIDRQARDIHYLNAELDDLEQYVPAYVGCRDAADTGQALGDAWHAWLRDKTQQTADVVNRLQEVQADQLAACRLDEAETEREQGEIVGAVAR